MGLKINTNIPAINANRILGQTSNRINKGFEGLASGLRINRARDDAAGLAIAERFEAQVRQLNAEVSSYQSGINAAQTADGGLSVQNDAVQRLRELAVQASNGTLTDSDRQALNQEAQQLLGQIDATAQNTTFNETNLLAQDQNIQIDAEGSVNLATSESTTNSLGIDTLDISTAAGASTAIDDLDNALQQISDNRSNLGAQQNRFESSIANRENNSVNLQASESAIRDLDIARATIEQTRNQILLASGVGMLGQSSVVPQNAARLLGG